MLKAHKIRLNPNIEQTTYFAKACGVARVAYNWALDEWEKQYKTGQKPSEASLRKYLNSIKREKFSYMTEVTKCAPQQAIKNVGTAYKNAFDRIKKNMPTGSKNNPWGFPKKKKSLLMTVFVQIMALHQKD